MAISLTKQDFVDKVFDYKNNKEWSFKGERPAIIDFYADWCGPCKMLSPIFEKLSKKYNNIIDFFKVDTEKEQDVASALGVQSLPTILFIPVDGKPKVSVGFLQEDAFENIIKDFLGF
ncbi:thioredoxin [Borreliella tanukii]|uniref:thioredoxin n=1 Tax=Borreliella tanukii TaxID=56146 RepID=UPI002647076E|nr:thioredoxin [Borreliella tanukii]WKC80405.1 thioredoxin [Borreliella tanukii]